MSTETTLKETLHTLVRLALAIPPELRSPQISATESANQALRQLAPKATGEDIHTAMAVVVGELLTEMGPEAFFAANGS